MKEEQCSQRSTSSSAHATQRSRRDSAAASAVPQSVLAAWLKHRLAFAAPCAGLSGLAWSDVPTRLLLRAGLAGLLVAVTVGWLWSRAPAWQFYLALLLGFGVAEAMAWAARAQRGVALQILGMICVALGLLLSRLFLLGRAGLSLAELVTHLGDTRLWALLQLRPLPDLLFVALALLIPFVRFRVGR